MGSVLIISEHAADTAGLPDCLPMLSLSLSLSLSLHHHPVLQVQRIDLMELKLPLDSNQYFVFHAGPSGNHEPEGRRAGRDLKVGLINVEQKAR